MRSKFSSFPFTTFSINFSCLVANIPFSLYIWSFHFTIKIGHNIFRLILQKCISNFKFWNAQEEKNGNIKINKELVREQKGLIVLFQQSFAVVQQNWVLSNPQFN